MNTDSYNILKICIMFDLSLYFDKNVMNRISSVKRCINV
jgi:hypothetical protein